MLLKRKNVTIKILENVEASYDMMTPTGEMNLELKKKFWKNFDSKRVQPA